MIEFAFVLDKEEFISNVEKIVLLDVNKIDLLLVKVEFLPPLIE